MNPTPQKYSSPPRWPTFLAFIYTFLLTLWSARLPDPLSPEMLFAALLWVILFIMTIVRLLLRRPQSPPPKLHLFRRLLGPLLLIIALILVRYDVPLRLAFDLSRSALDTRVHNAVTNPGTPEPYWAGLYPVQSVQLKSSPGQSPQVQIILSETRPGYNFIYFLSDPTEKESQSLLHLSRSWYIPLRP